MDFRTRQNFHPARSDLQPLLPGKRRPLALRAHTLAGTGELLVLDLVYFLPQRAGALQPLRRAGPFLVTGDPCKVGRQDRKGVGCSWHAYGGTVDPDQVMGVGNVVTSSSTFRERTANARRGGFQGHVAPTHPLSPPTGV